MSPVVLSRTGLTLVLTSIYLVMPPRGRIRPRHALVGGIAVGLCGRRPHILLWYFSTLSVVGVVYGSLAITLVGLLRLEIASIILFVRSAGDRRVRTASRR